METESGRPADYGDYENPRGADINLRSAPQVCEYVEIADRIAAEGLGPILDWGCGFGQITDLLARRGLEVESYEYREGTPLQIVTLDRFPGRTAYVSGEPVALPFPDSRFSAVLSCGVLEHVQQPEESLRELHRVLKPGGRLLIYKLPNRFSYLEAIARAAGLYYHGKLPYDRVYDRRRVMDILESNGFRVERVQRMNMLPLTIDNPFTQRHAERIWSLNKACSKVPILNWMATNWEADATAV